MLSSVKIQLEFEERDEAGKTKNRTLSQPFVIYASGIPEEMQKWLEAIAKKFNLGEP